MMMIAMTTISSIRVNPLLFTASSWEVCLGCLPAACCHCVVKATAGSA
jgi:hypothetical protein